MGRDIMNNPYGRFYNIAYYLSELGHSVDLILFSYKKKEEDEVLNNNLRLKSFSIFPNPVLTVFKLNKYIKQVQPDWVFGFSDTYYGILAQYFSNKYQKRSLIDAYDNYESYIPYAKPLHWVWRRAIKKSDLVTCAGPSLKELFRKYRTKDDIKILPMTVDSNIFFKRSKEDSRKKLGLPLDVKLVGYHGSIFCNRDIETLFVAARLIGSKNLKPIQFILAGRKDSKIKVPDEFEYLGYLPDEDMPLFINSLDVLVVTNKNSKFGNYSYPVKLYEALSCDVPVIVSKTKSTEWIMKTHPELLVNAGDASELSGKLEEVINIGRMNYEKLFSWKSLAAQLSGFIEASEQ